MEATTDTRTDIDSPLVYVYIVTTRIQENIGNIVYSSLNMKSAVNHYISMREKYNDYKNRYNFEYIVKGLTKNSHFISWFGRNMTYYILINKQLLKDSDNDSDNEN